MSKQAYTCLHIKYIICQKASEKTKLCLTKCLHDIIVYNYYIVHTYYKNDYMSIVQKCIGVFDFCDCLNICTYIQ